MSKYESVTVERATSDAGPWTLLATLTSKTTVTVVNEVPAQNSRITLDVGDNSWMTVGHSVNVIAAGLFRVIDKLGGTTQVRLEYLPRTFNNRTSQPIIVGTQVLPGYYVDNTNPGVGQTFHYRLKAQTDDSDVIDTFNTVSVENETQPPGSVLFVDVIGTGVVDNAKGVAVAPDGSYIITGARNGNIWAKIYNASNEQVFYSEFNTSAGFNFCAASDSQGNFYIGGHFYGIFFAGGTVGTLPGFGAYLNAYVLKLSPTGVSLWGKSFQAAGDGCTWGIATDNLDNCYVAGGFSSSIDFGDGTPVHAGSGSRGAFLVKYSQAGAFLGKRICTTPSSGSGPVEFKAVAVGANDVWVTGQASVAVGGTVSFGGPTFNGTGKPDVVVARYSRDNNITHAASQLFVAGQLNIGHGIAATPDGGCVVCGQFRGTLNFGGTADPLVHAGSAYEDGFMVKLNTSLAGIFSRHYAGNAGAYDDALGIACNASGEIAVTGRMAGAVNFGGQAGTAGTDYNDIYIVKYNAAGNALWVRVIHGISIDIGFAVAIHNDGTVYAVGQVYLNDTFRIDFGDGILRTGPGAGDAFVIKLSA